MSKINTSNISTATADQIDDILDRTAYAENGVTIGIDAANDQDLRRAAQKELARREGHA